MNLKWEDMPVEIGNVVQEIQEVQEVKRSEKTTIKKQDLKKQTNAVRTTFSSRGHHQCSNQTANPFLTFDRQRKNVFVHGHKIGHF